MFKKRYQPTKIFPVTVNEIEKEIKPYTIKKDNLTSEWLSYGFYLAKTKHLSKYYSQHFANTLSNIMTQKPPHHKTFEYYNQNKLIRNLENEYDKLDYINIPEEEIVKVIVEYLLSLYVRDLIKDFEKPLYRITPKLTWSEYKQFTDFKKEFDCKTDRETLNKLLDKFYKI